MSAAIEVEQPVTPRIVRKYSKIERTNALALYDQTGSLEKTAETLGIPLSTLHGWIHYGDLDSELRTQKSQELARKFENAAHRYLDLAAKKAKKAPFNHLMTAAGIAVDKMQLLRGEATSITQSVMSEGERQVKMAEIFSRLEQKAIAVQTQPSEALTVTPVVEEGAGE